MLLSRQRRTDQAIEDIRPQRGRSCTRFKQVLGLNKIRSRKPFSESIVDRSQDRYCLVELPSATVEPSETGTASQLPGKCLLLSSPIKRLEQGPLRIDILIRKQRSLYVALDPQGVRHIEKVSALLDQTNLAINCRQGLSSPRAHCQRFGERTRNSRCNHAVVTGVQRSQTVTKQLNASIYIALFDRQLTSQPEPNTVVGYQAMPFMMLYEPF